MACVPNATDPVITVTSDADSGAGSLRAAVEDANAHGGDVRLRFAIGSGSVTIRLHSPLPPIAFSGLIDGWTQPGFDGAPLIEINGAAAGTGPGLEIVHSGLTVRGVVMTSWAGDGIFVHDCDDVRLLGLYAGVGLDGVSAAGNEGSGIHALRAPRCLVGGPGTAAVVSAGNAGYGVLLEDGSHDGSVTGSLVGVDRTGTTAVPNQLSGIRVIQAGRCVIGGSTAGTGNVLSGNIQYGLEVVGPGAGGAIVVGNLVGTDATGTSAIPNIRTGMLVYNTADVRVGGPTPPEANVISGNARAGITVDGAYSELPEYPYSGQGHSHDNRIEGNLIGVDRTGEQPLGNELRGVLVNYSQDNTILRNVISANREDGILILGPEDDSDPRLVPTGNQVLENRIGTTAAGAPCGNGRHGVLVRHARANQIGASEPASANVISHNGRRGVLFSGTGATSNQLGPHNDLDDNTQGPFHQPRD